MRLEGTEGGGYVIYWHNGGCLGEFVKIEDGYYYWFPQTKNGCFSESVLACLHSELRKLNYEWDMEVQRELSKGANGNPSPEES